MAVSMLAMFVGIGLVFFYSLWLANEGLVTMAELMAPMWSVTGIMVPMMKAGALADIKNATNAAVRLFKLFDRVPLIDNLDESGKTLNEVAGNIEVKDVVFSYPTAPDHLVCKGYTLSIPAGQTVALCGPSGSGKSTVINLIERFYDPQSGAVMLDGVDIKTLNVRWLRSIIGLVGQEPVLFQGSISQNIGYGVSSGKATQKEIEEAAKMANAHGFITTSLGDGYKTDVGLKGGKLSGGQKQRIAIARAIIKKPAVLLLDEATSALDNESESIVQGTQPSLGLKSEQTHNTHSPSLPARPLRHLSLCLSLSLSFSLPLFLSLPLPLPLSLPFSPSLPYLFLSLPLPLPLSPSLSLSLPLTLPFFLYLSPSP